MSPALQAWSNVGNQLSGIGADYRCSSIPTTRALATVFREGTNVSTDLVVALGKGTTGADSP